ncbi:MAG: hypothetical protein D6726_08315, partial [Nitrospirae bacterium]
MGKKYKIWVGEGIKNIRLNVYGPAYHSQTAANILVLLIGVLSGATILFVFRDRLRRIFLSREKERLVLLLSRLKASDCYT